MTVATTDGESVWAFRYASEGVPRSLFYSTDVRTLREQHPEVALLGEVADESRLVVSEPLGSLAGAWNAVPESSYGVIRAGADLLVAFEPHRGT
jgi:glutamine amidotransferase